MILVLLTVMWVGLGPKIELQPHVVTQMVRLIPDKGWVAGPIDPKIQALPGRGGEGLTLASIFVKDLSTCTHALRALKGDHSTTSI